LSGEQLVEGRGHCDDASVARAGRLIP
jgi:hypothetical protein